MKYLHPGKKCRGDLTMNGASCRVLIGGWTGGVFPAPPHTALSLVLAAAGGTNYTLSTGKEFNAIRSARRSSSRCSHMLVETVLAAALKDLSAIYLHEHGIPFVVFYDGRLPDPIAIKFAERFYGALFNGHSVRESFACAKSAVPDLDDHYGLLAHDGIDIFATSTC
eukprot:m.130669 g.130669  ORF g.130669 m.130669 type:complete len:167 (+) comp9792_c1_seq1:291-791(+)